MHTLGRVRSLLGLHALLLGLLLPAISWGGDPDLVYQTLRTEHFNVHFTEGLEIYSRRMASMAEEVHADLSIRFGWYVDRPIELVITDDTDAANGWATSFPRPLIHLFATSPLPHSALSAHDDYQRLLFTHEYTHIVHIQIHKRLSRAINSIFGDIYLPNGIQPRWFIEGLAVLEETRETSQGRIRSPVYNMYVRTDALAGTMLNLGELSNNVRKFPRGQYYYIYGGFFLDYLDRRFGHKKIVEICHKYGAAPVPYGLNRIFKQVLGVDLVTLYADWQKDATERAHARLKQLESEGITSSRALTRNGESKGYPIFDLAGENVIVAMGDGEKRAGIFRIGLDDLKSEQLVLASARAYVSQDRSGRLFYTRFAPHKHHYTTYTDLFMVEQPGDDPSRLTFGRRAMQGVVSPDGTRVVYVQNDGGTTSLQLADDRGNPLRTLVESLPLDQVFEPSWSPDGKTIAAVVRRGGRPDVYLIDVASGSLEPVTDDWHMETRPVFDPTGRYLVFSTDLNGINNLYAFDLRERIFKKLTNVVSGATGPAISPNGEQLAFLYYSNTGHDVHLMPFDPAEAPTVSFPRDGAEANVKQVPQSTTAAMKRYNPLPSFLPRYWQLGVNFNDDTVLTVTTSFEDAAERHLLALDLDWNVNQTQFSPRFAYEYDGLGPSLFAGFSRIVTNRFNGYVADGAVHPWTQRTLGARVGLGIPIRGVDRSHRINVSYNVIHNKPIDLPAVEHDPNYIVPTVPRQVFRAGLEMGYQFNDTRQSPFGISPEGGRSLGASISLTHPTMGNTSTLATFRYNWSEFREAPWANHHVFAAAFSGAVHLSDPVGPAALSAGGYAELSIIDVVLSNPGAALPNLRGYPAGAFFGDRHHSLRLEYRLPIFFGEWAYYTLPLFFRHVQGNIFNDNSIIGFGDLQFEDWRSGIGAELIWIFYLGYNAPTTLRTGYARGLMEEGINEWYVRIGTAL